MIKPQALVWIDRVLYCVPAKCGHTSMRAAEGAQRPLAQDDPQFADQIDEIVLVVRHPEDRLQSAWRDLWPHLTWEEFVDSVLLNGDDETVDWHIKSQAWYLGGVTPDAVRTVGDVAGRNPKACIGQLNKSDRDQLTIPAYRQGEIMTRYAADYALWNQRRG